jgi:hypothetical protein
MARPLLWERASRTHCEQVKAELLNLKYILETKIQKYSGEY